MNVRVEQKSVVERVMKREEVIPGVSTPKALFMVAAGLSFLMSVSLFFTGSQHQGIQEPSGWKAVSGGL